MKKFIVCMSILLLFIVFWRIDTVFGEEIDSNSGSIGSNLDHRSYQDYLELYPDAKLRDKKVEIDLSTYTASGMEATLENDGLLTGERGLITWTFNVKDAGFYHLRVDYFPTPGKSSTIQREIRIDGEVPFHGAHQIAFYRIWTDENGIQKRKENEIQPTQIEEPRGQSVYVSDSQKYIEEPYQFYLSEGEHTLTFKSLREPLLISELMFEKADEVPSYEDYYRELSKDHPVYSGENVKFQAERTGGEDNHTVKIYKSSPTLYPIANFSNSKLEPYHPYDIRLNTIGGNNWRVIGDSITWDVQVPTTGLYALSMSVLQDTNRGSFSARELKINGSVPFKEAYAITYSYDSQFKMVTLGEEEPYLFYLEEGVNSISLQVTLGELGPIIQEVETSVGILNDLYRQVTQITGVTPNKYIDYQLEKKLPHMVTTFSEEANRLSEMTRRIKAIGGGTSNQTAILDQMVVQLKGLIKNPEDMINQINLMQNNISALSTWILNVSEQPLEIDYFVLSSPEATLPRVKANIFERVYFTIIRFISTFFVDYNNFSSDGEGETTIEVWTQSGRDQANIIRNLIDNTFTPDSNINVNLKLVPNGVVLPATVANKGPDIVLHVSGDTNLNFAMRGAAVDLSQFEDFEDIKTNFHPNSFNTVTYQGGVYGLPDTQSFYMLFFRRDILDKLGLEVPETWEELITMISVLEMNNYKFYMPTSLNMYATLVYQHGGAMYLGEGNDRGIESGLLSEEAMQAFKMWTDFYTSYKLEISADFTNRFRTGEMPIGVADYTVYNTLAVFAPEINGQWGFAALPGIRQEDGSVNHTSASYVGTTMMLENSKEKEASWEFMKWWSSTETQVNYGRALEGIMGAAARYNTANLEAVGQLPWESDNYDELIKQYERSTTVPEVPGSYITSRQVDYALRAVINEGQSPREALYFYVRAINEELTIKRTEFGLTTRKEED